MVQSCELARPFAIIFTRLFAYPIRQSFNTQPPIRPPIRFNSQRNLHITAKRLRFLES